MELRGVVGKSAQKERCVDDAGDIIISIDVRRAVQLTGDVARATRVPGAVGIAKKSRHGAPDGGETLRKGGHSTLNRKITMAKPFEI